MGERLYQPDRQTDYCQISLALPQFQQMMQSHASSVWVPENVLRHTTDTASSRLGPVLRYDYSHWLWGKVRPASIQDSMVRHSGRPSQRGMTRSRSFDRPGHAPTASYCAHRQGNHSKINTFCTIWLQINKLS